jgi:hypothetical protein
MASIFWPLLTSCLSAASLSSGRPVIISPRSNADVDAEADGEAGSAFARSSSGTATVAPQNWQATVGVGSPSYVRLTPQEGHLKTWIMMIARFRLC